MSQDEKKIAGKAKIKREIPTLDVIPHFLQQLIMTYKTYGLETKVGIKVRQIIDTHVTKQLVEETSPEATDKLVNEAVFAYYKKKQVEKLQ